MKTQIACGLVTTGLLIAGCSSPKLAGLAEKTNLQKKAKYDVNRAKLKENGRGFLVDMKKLGKMPQKVALISFYVDDPGLFKQSKSATTINYSTTNTGETAGKTYANYFLNGSIGNLKSTFKKYGMDLLTPSEFLTDDDKKQFYNDFVVKHTEINKIGEKLMKGLKNMGNGGTTLELDVPADGYNLVKINKREISDTKKKAVGISNLNGSNDSQLIESIGYDLCKNLEVDAVIVIFNTQLADTKWAKTRNWLGAVNMHMFGPNPLPLKEGKKDNFLYSKGLWYSGYRMAFKKGLLINPKVPKKATDAEKQAMEANAQKGYTNALVSIAEKMGSSMTKELNEK
jgi:hypothetical protein